jgi:hypothetical protein
MGINNSKSVGNYIMSLCSICSLRATQIAIVRQAKLESDYEFKLLCVKMIANKLFSNNPDFPATLQRQWPVCRQRLASSFNEFLIN